MGGQYGKKKQPHLYRYDQWNKDEEESYELNVYKSFDPFFIVRKENWAWNTKDNNYKVLSREVTQWFCFYSSAS